MHLQSYQLHPSINISYVSSISYVQADISAWHSDSTLIRVVHLQSYQLHPSINISYVSSISYVQADISAWHSNSTLFSIAHLLID